MHTIKTKTKSCFLFVCYLHSQFYNSNESVKQCPGEQLEIRTLTYNSYKALLGALMIPPTECWSATGAEPWGTTGCSGLRAAPGPAGHCHLISAMTEHCQGTATLPGYLQTERSRYPAGQGIPAQAHWVPTLSAQTSTEA